MAGFLDSASGEIAKNWALRALTPAFGFWTIGALAIRYGGEPLSTWPTAIRQDLTGADNIALIVLATIALALTSVSGWIVDRLTRPALRVLEGYWPLFWREAGIFRHQRLRDDMSARWRVLRPKLEAGLLDIAERHELGAIESRLRRYPARDRVMPTLLGNILRVAESRPFDKYGLDAVVCWPRLWLLLPKENREDIAAVRGRLDDAVRIWLWSLASLVWAWWMSPLLALAAFAAWLAHRAAREAARDYADLVESAFDARRILLYEAHGWPMPTTPASEKALGESLTNYLFGGSDAPTPEFGFRKKDRMAT